MFTYKYLQNLFIKIAVYIHLCNKEHLLVIEHILENEYHVHITFHRTKNIYT